MRLGSQLQVAILGVYNCYFAASGFLTSRHARVAQILFPRAWTSCHRPIRPMRTFVSS